MTEPEKAAPPSSRDDDWDALLADIAAVMGMMARDRYEAIAANDAERVAFVEGHMAHLQRIAELTLGLADAFRGERSLRFQQEAHAATEALTAASVRSARSTMWASWAMVVVALAAVVVALL